MRRNDRVSDIVFARSGIDFNIAFALANIAFVLANIVFALSSVLKTRDEPSLNLGYAFTNRCVCADDACRVANSLIPDLARHVFSIQQISQRTFAIDEQTDVERYRQLVQQARSRYGSSGGWVGRSAGLAGCQLQPLQGRYPVEGTRVQVSETEPTRREPRRGALSRTGRTVNCNNQC